MNNWILCVAVLLICTMCMTLGYVLGSRESTKSYTCKFENLLGTFQVTSRELDDESSMITVSREDRTFMFRRKNLTKCIEDLRLSLPTRM